MRCLGRRTPPCPALLLAGSLALSCLPARAQQVVATPYDQVRIPTYDYAYRDRTAAPAPDDAWSADTSRRRLAQLPGGLLERLFGGKRCIPAPPRRGPRTARVQAGGQCNPNDADETTLLESWGLWLKRKTTSQKRMCAINGLYGSVSIGDVVQTPRGQGVVVDYVLKDRVQQYIVFKDEKPGAKGRVKTRKRKAIRNLVVRVNTEPRSAIVGDGLTFGSVDAPIGFEIVELDPEETKAVIIARMLARGYVEQVTQVYPEERENLDAWRKKHPQQERPERLHARAW